MTWPGACSLFFAMVLLAALPSASVALVVARAATFGFANGAAVATGIVLGDLVFVSLALLGVSVLAETLGPFFVVFKCLGGAYLIAMGLGLLGRKGEPTAEAIDLRGSTLVTSFASGLFLTLGDFKAIVFYAGFFPIFVEMENLSVAAVATIVLMTILAVGSVKLAYAFAAQSLVACRQTQTLQKYARLGAGSLLVGVGIFLIAKA